MSRIRRIARKAGNRLKAAGRRMLGLPAGPAILMYHRVNEPGYDPWELAVTPAHFDEQLAWLKRRRTVLPLVEFAERHARGDLPRDAVAITFDDGYACNGLNAAPLLAAHGLPATVFLATSAISADHEYWWDDLERIVVGAPVTSMDIEIEGQSHAFDLGPAGDLHAPNPQRQAAYKALWQAMRLLDPVERRALLADLARRHGMPQTGRSSHRSMTRQEIQTLAAEGVISFGAHSVNHPALSELSREDQRTEIETSREVCAELLGEAPSTFAYPFGDYSDVTVDVVRKAGFAVAVTTDADVVRKGANHLRLPRLQVGDWPASRLSAALNA